MTRLNRPDQTWPTQLRPKQNLTYVRRKTTWPKYIKTKTGRNTNKYVRQSQIKILQCIPSVIKFSEVDPTGQDPTRDQVSRNQEFSVEGGVCGEGGGVVSYPGKGIRGGHIRNHFWQMICLSTSFSNYFLVKFNFIKCSFLNYFFKENMSTTKVLGLD